MKKRMLILLSVLSMLSPTTALASGTSAVIAISSAASTEQDDTVISFSDVIVWKYNTIENKAYRRIYNVTKKQYIGEWELMP